MARISIMKRDNPSSGQIVEKDRYETIICILSHGIQPVRIDAEGSRLIFSFNASETELVDKLILSGNNFQVTWQKVLPALNMWKDALVALKDRHRANAK